MKSSRILAIACAAALGMSTAGIAAEPAGRGDAKADTKADTKAEPKADTKADTKAEPKADTKAETKADPKGDAKGDTKATLAPAEIKGEVLKVDGDTFVVNDERSKKEVKFTIEKDVKAMLDRPLKQGDRIEAYLTPEGLAKKVRFEGAKDAEMMNQGGKNPVNVQSPDGFSREIPSGGQSGQPDQSGTKPAEGSNPTLSPSGKGSASGG